VKQFCRSMGLAAPFVFVSLLASAQDISPEELPSTDTMMQRIISRDVGACFRPLELRNADMKPQQSSGTNPVGANPVLARRVVVAIDGSGSMRAMIGGERKIDAARREAIAFVRGLDPAVDLAVVVFGHRGSARLEGRAESCGQGGAETVLKSGPGQRDAAIDALSRVQANGWTPLAAAIAEASNAFVEGAADGEQVVYVISDGVETCGGNPVAEARKLRQAQIRAVVNIIGFDVSARERAALAEVSAAGGGQYLDAKTTDDLGRVLRERLENSHRALTSRLSANHAQLTNTLAANHAINTTRICVQNVINTERLEMNRMLAVAAREKRLEADLRTAVQDQITARHARLNAELRTYVEAIGTANETQATRIREGLAEALRLPPRRTP
jgi:Ca-activated chloride channel homolog